MHLFRKISLLLIFVSHVSTASADNLSYEDVKPTFDRYCIRCHGNAAHAGGADFENYPFKSVVNDASTAQIVTRAITRMRATSYPMPPGGGVPSADIDRIEAWLAGGLR